MSSQTPVKGLIRVLVVEDDADKARQIRQALAALQSLFAPPQIVQKNEVPQHLAHGSLDAIVLSVADASGLNHIDEVRKLAPDLPIVVLTDPIGKSFAECALERGARDCISRDALTNVGLVRAITQAVEPSPLTIELPRRLQETNERCTKLFRSCPAAVGYGTLEENRIIEVNPSYLDFFGYRRDELIGRSIAELGLWADLRHRDQVVRRLHQEGSVRKVECQLRRKSGEIRCVHLSMEILEASVEPVLNAMFLDVTDSKHIQAATEQQAAAHSRLAILSPRERQVLELMVEGQMSKVIARKLDISEKTVEKHRGKLMKKLAVRSVAHLVRLALTAAPGSL